MLKDLKEEIHVEKGAFLLGVLDEMGSLGIDQVYTIF